jgi:hypothetical protein
MRHGPHPEAPAKLASKDEGVQAGEEFASPACYAHEMDPAYLWAEPRRREGWLRRAMRLLRRRGQT